MPENSLHISMETDTRGKMDCEQLVEAALQEDLGSETLDVSADITGAWTVPAEMEAAASIYTRQSGIITGLSIAAMVFQRLNAEVEFEACCADGERVAPAAVVAHLHGAASALLTGERTALNFLQHLSGISTLTRAFVDAVAGTGCRITDTRKTTPGFRLLEKYAVRKGGGVNHRMGLHDAVLIKENHAVCAGGVGAAVRQVRQAAARAGRKVPVYVEAEDLVDVKELLGAGPDRVMLDNMTCDAMREAVAVIRRALPGTEIEATGGVTLANVRQIAETGVDLISIGALTHSAAALDLSMLIDIDS